MDERGQKLPPAAGYSVAACDEDGGDRLPRRGDRARAAPTWSSRAEVLGPRTRREIPPGAHVEGGGEALAADIGGAIKGNWIDLCFLDPSAQPLWQKGRMVKAHPDPVATQLGGWIWRQGSMEERSSVKANAPSLWFPLPRQLSRFPVSKRCGAY